MPYRHPDPWQTLASTWPWVKVYIRRLPDRWGQTIWGGGKPYIELAHDLGRAQQRCTLAHEIHHLASGCPHSDDDETDERKVVEATARWLLPDLTDVGDALRDQDIDRAAAALDVTRQVLMDRLTHLLEHEEEQLGQMLRDGTFTAQAAHERGN